MDVNQVLMTVAAVAAVGVAGGLVLSRSLLWQLSLIVMILTFCGGRLYPPGERLKFGLDLAGGTSLLYEVSVPEGRNTDQAVRQTIETLKRRVDPEGLRNLEWQQEAGNRIEVRMPRPNPLVQERRAALTEITERIERANISRQEVRNLLDAEPGDRPGMMQDLERGVEQRIDLFGRLVDVEEQLSMARSQYERLPEDSEQRRAAARVVARAERNFDQAMAQVMATNVVIGELREVMDLPTGSAEPNAPSPQERGIARLQQGHPHRTQHINAYVEAYRAYEAEKGPLDDPEDLKRLMRGAGVLEFRLTVEPEDNVGDLDDLREQLRERGPASFAGSPYVWVEVDDLSMFAKTAAAVRAARENTAQYFLQNFRDPQTGTGGYIAARFGEDIYMLCWDTPDKSITTRPSQDGWKIQNVSPQPEPQTFFPAVGVDLNSAGGRLMSRLTRSYQGRHMAMVLDGSLLSAPTINTPFAERFIITGGQNGFSPREQDYLIRTLGAGTLLAKVSPEPIAVRTVGPSLGEDNLRRGLQSAVLALVVVGVFMMIYYLFSGAVAGFALVANILIILGIMATPFFTGGASFTLPGIAGIVLTIGMCVDANVLIFERIREELIRGADSQTATRLGYQRALSSIVDSNITNLIVCVILYQTATVEVRGFAVTLGIGIVATLITSLFMTRAIFKTWAHLFGLGGIMNQTPTVVPAIDKLLTPNFRWMSKKPLFFGVSLVAIAVSLVLVVERGANMLDIEFRGGTEVAFELADGKTMTLDEARERRTQIAALYTAGPAGLSGERAEIARWLRAMVDDRREELLQQQTRKLEAAGRTADADALRADIAEATDLARLKDATVVSVGDPNNPPGASGPNRYNAFSMVSTVEDQQVVSSAVKREFADVLDVQSRLNFDAEDVEEVAAAPVYPIDQPTLGEVIGRDAGHDVSTYRGGAAMVVTGIDPGATLGNIEERLRAMRLQPDFEKMSFREWTVLGLDNVPGDVARYRSVAIVVKDPKISYFTDPGAWDQMARAEWTLVREALTRDTSLSKVSNFTPTVAQTLRDKAIVALVLSFLAIVAYIWLRFGSLRYGMAAITAIVHDVIVALGLVAATHFLYDQAIGEALLLGEFKLNLGLIAALLTIVGYSLNDTIVLFDRIRENRGKLAYATASVIDRSINQTISRTVLTSLTTLLAVGVLYVYGGEGIRGFAFALIVGVLVGSYSSVAIAAPLVGLGAGPSAQAEPTSSEATQPAASAEAAPAGV